MQVNNISEKLKEIRLNKGLTIESISNVLNVSKQGYSLWEQQKRNWNIDTLVKLSSILDFEMIIKNGEIIILENSSDDYIGICSDEESNKIIKNQLQNKPQYEDINDENIENINLINDLIKKIKYKNILKKYPLCNYLLEEIQRRRFSYFEKSLYINKDEIKKVSKQNMNHIEMLKYIERQTKTALIIFSTVENSYMISVTSLFNFYTNGLNNFNETYFSIRNNLAIYYKSLKSVEYKNSIIIAYNYSNYCDFEKKHNYLYNFLKVSSKFINKDIDTLDKDTYKNTLKFKINFKELKEFFENENTKYDNYLEFKSNVITKIIKDASKYDLEIKFNERNKDENIILDFKVIY